VGTVVLLDTNELGVVVKVSGNIDKADRPTVKVIADPHGNAVDGDLIDLDEQDEKTGQYRYSIMKTIDPSAYGLDVSRYFI